MNTIHQETLGNRLTYSVSGRTPSTDSMRPNELGNPSDSRPSTGNGYGRINGISSCEPSARPAERQPRPPKAVPPSVRNARQHGVRAIQSAIAAIDAALHEDLPCMPSKGCDATGEVENDLHRPEAGKTIEGQRKCGTKGGLQIEITWISEGKQ